MKTVVVLGASPKPDRYAFMAMERLQQHGYKAVPVNPAFPEILGEKCYAGIGDVPGAIDTVTVYLGEARRTFLKQSTTGVGALGLTLLNLNETITN